MSRHIHILGICGTFMGSLAVIAKQKGFRVTGSDQNVYPPMSTYLQSQGIEIINGYDVDQLNQDIETVIIGNCMKRGMPIIEHILNEDMCYASGPEWLYQNVLKEKHVIAVSGTHGKTTTTSMIVKILLDEGLDPGFLIGGVSQDFSVSSRLTDSPYFVIEADEYDTAFFDKRSKFIHYRPDTLVINNLEFDHADIFNSIDDIYWQFHQMIRALPQKANIVMNSDDPHIHHLLKMGCWSTCHGYGNAPDIWNGRPKIADSSSFEIHTPNKNSAVLTWNLIGEHNRQNAMSAVIAAHCVGIPLGNAVKALSSFKGVKRRLEVVGSKNSTTIYDDFAHHPTAIEKTISGLRARVGQQKIIAIAEPRSNTMKMGVHQHSLAKSLAGADSIFIFEPNGMNWSMEKIFKEANISCHIVHDVDVLVNEIAQLDLADTHLLVMSNGAFGGIHQKLMNIL